MAVGFSGVASNVSISGNVQAGIGLPSSTQTIVQINGTGNASNQNAYSVPASKIFYLFAVMGSGGGGRTNCVYLNNGTTRVYQKYDVGSLVSDLSVVSSFPLGKYVANENVVVNWTNTQTYTLIGVLVDA